MKIKSLLSLFVTISILTIVSCGKGVIKSSSSSDNSAGGSQENLRIFMTDTDYQGDSVGGLAGADTKCNDLNDANHPQSGNYKAMLFIPNSRDVNNSWIMAASTTYTRTDGTIIGTTNAQGVFVTMSFRINNAGPRIWTGAQTDWTAHPTNNCNGWNAGAGNGNVGEPSDTTVSEVLWAGGNTVSNCQTQSRHLVCIEQ